MKIRTPASTLKKVVLLFLDRSKLRGYLNPGKLGDAEELDLLTPEGEHRAFALKDMTAADEARIAALLKKALS